MAGAGASVMGAGMLRTRRRDVSIKPNRRLDRKSSRGMIYENEELRLRTIHINAEVEQGQNDIKKLRRENEQLRKEIWSLRDEYDKLEELLKTQKSNEGSDESEDRSEEDEDIYSDYSEEEDEEDEEIVPEDDQDQEERLENAENQKISSEKMNSSLRRLHVDFDDLSIVDEEEELNKKERDRRDGESSEDNRLQKDAEQTDRTPKTVNTRTQDGFRYFPPAYELHSDTLSSSSHAYFTECPFVFPNPNDPNYPKMLPMENPNLLMSPSCSRIYSSPLTPLPCLDTPVMGPVPPIFGPNEHMLGHNAPIGSTSQIGANNTQIGWQSNLMSTPRSPMGDQSTHLGLATVGGVNSQLGQGYHMNSPSSQISNPSIQMRRPSGQMIPPNGSNATPVEILPFQQQDSVFGTHSGNKLYEDYPNDSTVASFPQRRKVLLKQPINFFNDTLFKNPNVDTPNSGEGLTQNGWDFTKSLRENFDGGTCAMGRDVEENGKNSRDSIEGTDKAVSEASTLPMPEKPKHFFAPLPHKQKMQRSLDDKFYNDSPTTPCKLFGTANSSSSDRTTSTVVSRNGILTSKGSVDVFVNGGFPVDVSSEEFTNDVQNPDQKTFLSTENLSIEEVRNISRQSSNNPLVKSLSCQDLSSDPLQNLSFSEKLKMFNAENGAQKLTQSDNTLDNISNSSRPYKSQLNVTLKLPKCVMPSSPDTPEVPQLPSINYKLFSNPFLQSFNQGCSNYANLNFQCPVTRPLSIQVNENAYQSANNNLNYSSPMLLQSSGQMALENDYCRLRGPNQTEDPHGLLMATNQTRGFEGSNSHRILSPVKQGQDYQVTSFEGPNPHTLLQPMSPYDSEAQHRLPAPNSMMQNQRLYQNMSIPNGPAVFPQNQPLVMTSPVMARMLYDNSMMTKVPAQTQTSIDGDSNKEDKMRKDSKSLDAENPSAPSSPTLLRRKRTSRKEKSNSIKDKRPLSPAAQRRKERLRKQSSVTSADNLDSPAKTPQKPRKFSITTSTSEIQDKNESRSSSSGLDSPKKEQKRRVSIYFNAKKRPSLSSVKMGRSSSLENPKDRYLLRRDTHDGTTTNSERERTNSVSSRETITKGRKMSTSSGKVPWCACWGNGCI